MIRIIEELGRVQRPPYKDAQFIEVKVQGNIEEDPQEIVMHESMVTLLRTLERLQKTANIYPDNMNKIWSQIRDYARSEYKQGYYSGFEIAKDEENE
jgi:hypothetical protein